MNNFESLLSRLTEVREMRDEELDEAIARSILRLLRHGDPSADIIHNGFGLVPVELFNCWVREQFSKVSYERFQQRFRKQIDELMVTEKIEFRAGGIRALYGHSIRGIIVGQMKWPDTTLFHATRGRHLGSIFEYGLRPQSRTWVHLTSDIEYAHRILKNHSFDEPPALLSIDAEQMEGCDVTFRQPNSHVWLANHIPPAAIGIVRPNDHSENYSRTARRSQNEIAGR